MSEINSEEEKKKEDVANSTENVIITKSDSEIDPSMIVNKNELNELSLQKTENSTETVAIDKSDSSIDSELEKNKKEIEAMISSAKKSDIKLDKKDFAGLDLSFTPKAGLRPIDIPRADAVSTDTTNNQQSFDISATQNTPPKSLVPEYTLSFDENLKSPFSDEEIAFIKEKKMINVTTGNSDDIAAKKENFEMYGGKKKITYKKAAPFFQRNKRVIQFFGLVCAMILVAIIFGFTFRQNIKNFYLDKYINDNGIPIKSFNVVDFNSEFVDLTDVKASDGSWSMGRFKMTYNRKDLSEGYISKIEINNFKSKYVTVLDLLQGQAFRSLTNGKQATISSIKIDGNTDLDFAQISFTSNSMSLRNDKIDTVIPVKVKSDLVNFEGKMKFSGNYEDASLVFEIQKGNFKKFKDIEPEITAGNVVFKKNKTGIEVIETNITAKISDKTTWYLTTKATPSPSKGFDLSAEYKIDSKYSDDDRKITTIKADAKSAELTGNPFAFKGKLPLKLSISGYKDDAINLNNIMATLDGSISCIKHKCDYRLDGASNLTLDSMTFTQPKHRVAFEETPTSVTLSPNNDPFISVKDNNIIEYAFNMSDVLLKGQYVSGLTIKSFESDLGLVNVKGNFDPVKLTNETNLSTDGGYYTDNAFGIGGLRATVFAKTAQLPNLKVNSDEIHFYGKEKLLPVYSGELSANSTKADEYEFKIVMQSLNRDMAVNIAGNYNIADDAGNYVLNVPKIVFADGGAQLSSISPHYAHYIGRLNGAATIHGIGTFSNGNYDGITKMLIEKATFNWGKVKFNNLNGVVSFKGFYPLTTDGEQILYASLIDVGYPLYDNTMSFRINGNERIIVDRISSTFADGMVLLREKSFIPFNLSGGVLNVEIKNIDLPSLVDSLKINNLSLNGKAGGNAQLYISKGFVYTDATLETTDKGGLLKYNFDEYEFEDEETKKQMLPLKDFSYDHILAKIKGRPGTNYSVDLELEGINPEINTDGIGSSVKIDLQSDFGKLVKTKPILTPVADEVIKNMKSFNEPTKASAVKENIVPKKTLTEKKSDKDKK